MKIKRGRKIALRKEILRNLQVKSAPTPLESPKLPQIQGGIVTISCNGSCPPRPIHPYYYYWVPDTNPEMSCNNTYYPCVTDGSCNPPTECLCG